MICFSFCQISWFSSPHFTNFTFFLTFFRLVLVLNEKFVWSNVERFSSLEGIK